MHLATQSTTQVYSPFGTYVVEQHDNGPDAHFSCDVLGGTYAPMGDQTTAKSTAKSTPTSSGAAKAP